jgi:hypothetical protein
MVLVILLINVPIRIRKLINKMTLKRKIKSKRVEETIFFSRKVFTPRKPFHQTKTKTSTMIQREYFLWKYKTLMRKAQTKNVNRKNPIIEKN